MKNLLPLFLVLSISWCSAQNLVPNPSFEDHTQCPNNGGQLEYALHWTNPLIGSSPDYLNSCSLIGWSTPQNTYGYEVAHSGIAYAAIILARYNPISPWSDNAREYIQTELLDTLVEGVEYCFRFYVSASDSNHYVTSNIGVYFSTTEVRDTCQFCNLTYTPQFENDIATNDITGKIGWHEVSGSYTALGGERYIVIGNFRDTLTTIATYVGGGGGTDSLLSWFSHSTSYIDDVFLAPCYISLLDEKKKSTVTAYPNPSNGVFFLNQQDEKIKAIEIFNSDGRKIFSNGVLMQEVFSIDIRDHPNGIYLLSVTTQSSKKFFKIFKT